MFITLLVKHHRVSDRIFVEVDAAGIPPKLCSRIFSSFRNELRSVPEAEALEEEVAKWLNKDMDLIEIEAELTREALKSVGQKVSQGFLDRLNRAIEAKMPGSVKVPAPGRGNGPKPPKAKTEEELGEEPTFIDMPTTITLVPGTTYSFYMATNAVDGFIPDRATPELRPAPSGISLSYGYLSAGRLQLAISADPKADLADQDCSLELAFLAKAGGLKTLSHPLKITIVSEMPEVEPQPPKKNGTATEEKPGRLPYAFVWSRTSAESNWTDDTAGELQPLSGDALAALNSELYAHLKDVTGTIPTIVLNETYRPWAAYAKTISVSDATLAMRKQSYALSMGVVIAELFTREKAIEAKYTAWKQAGEPTDEPPQAMTQQQKMRSASSAARGIVTMMPDFDAVASAVAVV